MANVSNLNARSSRKALGLGADTRTAAEAALRSTDAAGENEANEARNMAEEANLEDDGKYAARSGELSRKPPLAAANGERPRAKAPQKRKQNQQSLLNIEENEGSPAAAGSPGTGTGSAVDISSSEQRLQAVNVTKPVVPLKSIQFSHLNTRSGRGLQGRSPAEDGKIEPSTNKDNDLNSNISKFAMQQQLTNSDQQLKERQRLINQQNNNNLRILSANLVNLNPNATSS